MGIIDKAVSVAFKKQDSAIKETVQVLGEQNGEIILRLNWILRGMQKLADHAGVELDDPLEVYK